MIERPNATTAGDGPLRNRLGRGLIAAMLAISACVSEADPREGNRDPLPDVRAQADVREGGASDAARADAQDTSVPDADDSGSSEDAGADSAIDAGSDVIAGDVGDDVDAGVAGDARGPDTTDVTTDPVVADAVTDTGSREADAPIDTTDVGTGVDTADSGPPIDVNDAGAPSDVGDAANASDGDANATDAGADSADASDGAGDGGVVIFYQENFDTGFGTFAAQTAVCGTAAQWSTVPGYLHASEPILAGVSRISNSAVPVPPNLSNIMLRMSHRCDFESGWDAAHLLISVNGGTATQVMTFTSGGYTTGGQTNPANCMLTNTQGQYPGWSGNQAEFVSVVNLSAAPFNVVSGNTVTIAFRVTTDIDNLSGGGGWDINWVALSANSP